MEGTMMIRCKAIAELLASDQLREAGFATRLRVKLHLWMCKYCSRFQKQLEQLRSAARDISSSYDERISCEGEDFEARLLRKLSKDK
jgi:hypothetical protein